MSMLYSRNHKKHQAEQLALPNVPQPTTKNVAGQDNKKYPAFQDNDLMPFGKYKNERMQDVPPSYLAWLWKENCSNIQVKNYIWNSRHAINQELDEEVIITYK